MMDSYTRVSFRQQAIFVPYNKEITLSIEPQEHSALFASNLAKLGFGLSEALWDEIHTREPEFLEVVLDSIRDILGVNKNWTPLVKNWDVPTGESFADHLLTFYANVFGWEGTTLPCGHLIPGGTFPLERYNGCPFCGTPFVLGKIEVMGQGSQLKVLDLWQEQDLVGYFADLLRSKTALDATQMDSLKLLLDLRPLPSVEIGMKESRMAVIDHLVDADRATEAERLFSTPADILRYLWYKHTDHLQLVQPKKIIARKSKNRGHLNPNQDKSQAGSDSAKEDLKLNYTRPQCRMAAGWLNGLAHSPEKAAEIMHPKREIWVRFIRALRLVEYSKRDGFAHLKAILETFHGENYPVWQASVEQALLKHDATATFQLLQERPGVFARSLFANMLTFGPEKTVAAFSAIAHKVPARLLMTLAMYANTYFRKDSHRIVKPLGGIPKVIPVNSKVNQYSEGQLEAMVAMVGDLCVSVMERRFRDQKNPHQSIYIAPELYKMPVAIGDRSEQLQDLPVALMGSRFPIEGHQIRLFLQWGVGLPAQHLDMDLSCHVAYDEQIEVCSYFQLTATGCKHSGDIQRIPDQVGTAEYIELDLNEIAAAGVRTVTFSCNAYSNGELSPNLVVGWMNSRHPMQISEKTGVAYDPSTVQHQVRIKQGLSKGLVFGVLEVDKREVVWLEMPFEGQTIQTMSLRSVKTMLGRLDSKLNIGNLLALKARSQQLRIVNEAEKDSADEVYTAEWGRNAAQVTQLLVD